MGYDCYSCLLAKLRQSEEKEFLSTLYSVMKRLRGARF